MSNITSSPIGTSTAIPTPSPEEKPKRVGTFNFEAHSVLLNSGYEMPLAEMGTYGFYQMKNVFN